MAILKAVNVKVGKNASLKGIINYFYNKEFNQFIIIEK